MKRVLILSVFLGALCGFTQAAERPNNIVILADDSGHGALLFSGKETGLPDTTGRTDLPTTGLG